ncbi:hypothetical protein NL676_017327 [Syzygium grande]|nr:hypothetical protein NL676_017327 [Syzygium grande]
MSIDCNDCRNCSFAPEFCLKQLNSTERGELEASSPSSGMQPSTQEHNVGFKWTKASVPNRGNYHLRKIRINDQRTDHVSGWRTTCPARDPSEASEWTTNSSRHTRTSRSFRRIEDPGEVEAGGESPVAAAGRGREAASERSLEEANAVMDRESVRGCFRRAGTARTRFRLPRRHGALPPHKRLIDRRRRGTRAERRWVGRRADGRERGGGGGDDEGRVGPVR